MHFEIASRGKQMVSKEAQKLAPILGLNLYFWGTQFWPPNSIEACFRTATEMAPIGSKNGAAWRAHFWCHILWTSWLDYDKRGANKKKEMRPHKIETREAQMNATKIWAVLKARNGPQLGGPEAW